MRSTFHGYYRPDEATIGSIWKSGTVVAESNVLLDLYRYSKATCQSWLDLLGKLGDRLWIPYQVGLEFHRNRLGVIAEGIQPYDEAKADLRQVVDTFESQTSHPYVQESSLVSFKAAVDTLQEDLASAKERMAESIRDDALLTQLTHLYEGRVGPAPDSKEERETQKEGRRRYENRIPPGYRDFNKNKDRPEREQYGDYRLWRQLLERAAEVKRNVILIQGDRKEDWYVDVRGELLGPRPELVMEFVEETGQQFLMYTPVSFLRIAPEKLNVEVADGAVTEAETIAHLRSVAARVRHTANLSRQEIVAQSELDALRSNVAECSAGIRNMQAEIAAIAEDMADMETRNDPTETPRVRALRDRTMRLQQQIHEALMWRSETEDNYQSLRESLARVRTQSVGLTGFTSDVSLGPIPTQPQDP
jgi:hypothetical protein